MSELTWASRLRRLAAIIACFALWQIGADLADNRLFPPPDVVVEQLWEDIETGVLWEHAKTTFARGLTGLGIALVVGIALGVGMARSQWLDAALEPAITAFYPVPKLALFPVFILILGFGAASKVALVALECAYPILYNTYAGVQGTRKQYVWVAHNVGARRREVAAMFMRSASPSILASLRMAVPIMLVIMVITEFLGESQGLGFLIRQAGTEFAPESGLAVILFLAIVGYALDRAIVWFTRRATFWERGVQL